VPPPPVAGAPTGTGLAVWLCATVGVAEGELALGLGELGEAVLLAGWVVLLTVAERLLADENGGGVDDGEDPEQAATEAEASMANAAPLTADSLVLNLVPVPVMGMLTEPPP
jgi:hypothetical protein